MSTPAPSPGIVTLDEVNEWLKHETGDPVRDAKLSRLIDAATVLVEGEVGPVQPREVTADFTPTGRVIILPVPIMSVASVTSYTGGTATVWTEDDPTAATPTYPFRVELGPGLLHGAWPFGSTVRVAYVAGRSTIPANISQAVLEQIRLWWESSQNPTRPELGLDGADLADSRTLPSAGLHPWIKQMLAPHRLGPAVA